MKAFIATLSLVLATAAQADPASTASIERLLELTDTRSQFEQAKTMIEPMVRETMDLAKQQAQSQDALNARQQAVIDRMPARFAAVINEMLDWERMKPEYIQLYRESFDQAEIDGMLAFYQSPVGQSMIRKMPTLTRKSMALSQQQMRALLPKLQALQHELMTELKAASSKK